MIIIILLTMIFLHIVDDYYLQGVLAQMKHKRWWKGKNWSENSNTNHDYIMALIEHGFSNTFMIHIPFFYMVLFKGYNLYWLFPVFTFIIAWVCHSITDHIKINLGYINLIEDQIVHIVCIISIWGVLFVR